MNAHWHAALLAALHGALITAGYVLAAYILIAAAWFAVTCCRRPERDWPPLHGDQCLCTECIDAYIAAWEQVTR